MTLKLYSNDHDYVFASSKEEAENSLVSFLTKELGYKKEMIELDDWEIFDDEKEFTLNEHEFLAPDFPVRRKVSEWAKLHGPGYFASSDW